MVNSADVSLLFGVLGGGKISGESGTLIKSQLDSIVASLNNATNSKQRRIKLNLDFAGTKSSFSTGLKQITNGLSGQKQFKIKVSEIDATSAINKLKSQLNAMLKTLSVKNGMTITMPLADGGSIVGDAGAQALDEAKVKAAEFAAQLASIKTISQSVSSAVKGAMNGSGAISESEALKGIIADYTVWLQKIEELKASKESLEATALQSLQAEGLAITERIASIQAQQRVQAAADSAAENSAEAHIRRLNKLNSLQKAAETALKYTSARHTEQYRSIEIANNELKEMSNNYTKLNDENLNRLDTQIRNATAQIRSMGLASKSIGDIFLANAKKFTSWLGTSRLIMLAYNSLKKMVTAVRDVDTAMTELKKVTNETDVAYTRFLENAIARSKTLGATVADTVTATADFARLGYSIDDASMLADSALVYKNVGDGIEDISTASESIISTMRAFGIEAEGAMFIVDKFNEVGNNFAISSKGVGDALIRSASALAAGNNTLNESIALITAANSVVQDADKVGTTLKTISMYLRAAKTEAEEAGESTEGMADSVSALRSEILSLTGGKVDIQLDENTFKSTYQIIKELSSVWNELTDISQANILEMIGGKRNSNVVAALITNFQTAEDVVETAANASGSALAENEKYLDSISGKVAKFQAAFQELSLNVFDSELVKIVVDFGAALLSAANALAELNLLLPITAAFITTVMTMRKVDQASALASSIVNAVSSGLAAESEEVKSLAASYAALTAARQKDVIAIVSANLAQQGLTQEQIAAKLAALGLTTATSGQTAANYSLAASFKAVMASNPVGWIMLAISLIPTVIGLIGKLHKSNEELIQDAEDLKTSYGNSFTGVAGELSTLRGLEEEFNKLSTGVDDYGNNISLAADDYERYREIVATILGISPSLISGYDAEGNAIANKNGLLEKSIELMEEEQRLKMKEFVSDKNLTTIGLGEVAAMEEYEDANPLPYGDAKLEFMNAFHDAANRYAAEARTNYEGEIYDALNPGNIDLDDFWTQGYWSKYGDDANRFAQDYYETIVEALRSNRSVLEDYFTQGEIDELLDIADEYDKNMEAYKNRIDEFSQALNPTLQYVPQTVTAYSELTDGQKEFLTNYINNFRITADTTEEDILQMKQDILDFTDFIAQNEDLRQSIDLGMSIKYGVNEDGDGLTVSEYKKRVEELNQQIASYDEDMQVNIRAALGIEVDAGEINSDVEKAIAHVKNLLREPVDGAELEAIIDGLSIEDVLQIYYNISAEPGSMTFEELQNDLEKIGIDWDKTINAWDFSAMVDGISDIESGISSLISAMDSLREGTKLTKGELAKLALEYPDLLKVSDLFADTTIENQQSMLSAILDTYEKEHDALIDTKIAELTATNQLIQDQITLENEKKNKVVEIADLQNNGKLDSEKEYQRLLNELRDLDGQNYVAYSDGMLDVNEDMLTKMLENDGEKVEDSKPIWGAQGDMIVEAHSDGLSNALKAFPTYLSNLKSWATGSLSAVLSNIGTAISDAFSGKGFSGFGNLLDGVGGINSVATIPVKIDTKIEGAYTIDDKSIDEWSSNYQEVIQQRVQTLTDQLEANTTIIDNLTKLKGLDLQTLYDEDDGSKSDKVEEYTAEIERYREALERLNQLRIQTGDLEMQLSNTDDLDEQIRLEKELLNVYQGEQDILEEINALRDDTISNGVKALERLGFVIDYDSDNNKFFVKNLEHLNELTASSVGDYKNLQEATNALRKDTEELINTLEDLNAENQEDKDTWQELYHTIREAKINIVNNLKEIVSQASAAVDSIQNVYGTLKDAADEYAANGGFISVDAFQKIVELGPEYMQYLRDENGLLVINEQSINRVIVAKTEQLALENAMSYVERIRLALQGDSIESLNTLLFATTDATNATWGLVYAELALMHQMGDLNDSQYEAAMHNINAIRSLAENAITGVGQVANTVEGNLTDMKQGLDDILKYVMDMLRHKIEQQIDALEDMKDSYGELIDLKKESMEAAKEETDYQDEVAKKVKEIAKLQERINALSLDDSRDAQAQKAQLQEEMAELQKELADTQADYAYDAQQDSLDKMQEAYEAEKDKEIEILKESIGSEQKLYEKAISYIQSNWDTLYQELIGWNTKYGSVLNSEITTAWDNCLAAAKRYGSYVSALNSIGTDIEDVSNGSNTIVGNTSGYDTSSSDKESIHAIIKEMYANSRRHGSEDAAGKAYLNRRNLELGSMLARYGITAVRGDDGVWYVNRVGGEQLYEKYKQYIYHTGGIAGDEGTLKENELLAKIEKGEVMVSNHGKSTLFSLIEFVDMLNKRLDTADVNCVIHPGVDDGYPDLKHITNNQNENIRFGDVYIYGADEQTAEKHREINREFANEVLKHLKIKR